MTLNLISGAYNQVSRLNAMRILAGSDETFVDNCLNFLDATPEERLYHLYRLVIDSPLSGVQAHIARIATLDLLYNLTRNIRQIPLRPMEEPKRCTKELENRDLARKRFYASEAVEEAFLHDANSALRLLSQNYRYDQLLDVSEIPPELVYDETLSRFKCAIQERPMRIPIFVHVKRIRVPFICDLKVFEKKLKEAQESQQPIPKLDCFSHEIEYWTVDLVTLTAIDDRLCEISLLLKGMQSPSSSLTIMQNTPLNAWTASLYRTVNTVDTWALAYVDQLAEACDRQRWKIAVLQRESIAEELVKGLLDVCELKKACATLTAHTYSWIRWGLGLPDDAWNKIKRRHLTL